MPQLKDKIIEMRWPLGIVAGLLTVIIVNLNIYSIAQRTRPEPILKGSPYEAGLLHQKNIDQKQAMMDRGWKVQIEVQDSKQLKDQQVISVSLIGAQPGELTSFAAKLALLRPNQASQDQEFALRQQNQSIHFTAVIPRLAEGLWLADFVLESSQEILRSKQQLVF